MNTPNHAILLIYCTDRKGLISIISQFLTKHNGNIVELEEHVEKQEGLFFMRVKWELEGFDIAQEKINEVFNEEIARHFEMKWRIYFDHKKPRMALFVSKSSHCLYDILSRHYSGEWQVEIPLIVSNHKQHESLAKRYEIPFHHFEVTADNKESVEATQIKLLKDHDVDLIILARYMQVLSQSFIETFQHRIINIHHSFLPAFAGARPYHRAFERGVKIIGATAHYATADLDEGPILEQDVTRVTHKDQLSDLVRKGKDLEKIVLSRAIRLHLEQKVLVYKNKTVIFD